MSFLRYCTFISFLFLPFITSAQEFRNIQLTQRGDFVDITFDLAGTDGRTYTILVLSSHNDASKALEFVSGDVGDGIIPGNGKKIVWNANLEVGNKNMTVRISLEGNTDPPFLSILAPSGGKFKKGKQNQISWEGDTDSRIRIDVLKAGKSIQRLGDVPNNGSYDWGIPKDFDSGKDYQIRFTNLSNNNVYITSDYFTIGAAFGIGAKIGIAGAVAAGVIIAVLQKPPTDDPIELPPRPE